jgi:hypothetical protein
MRVSDAERSEIADRLSEHYGEGRLDQSEFSDRLDRAMSAKTQSDLNGLLADLPGQGPPPPGKPGKPGKPPRPRSQRPGIGRILLLALIVIIAVSVAQALLHTYMFWILVALGAFIWLRLRGRHRT